MERRGLAVNEQQLRGEESRLSTVKETITEDWEEGYFVLEEGKKVQLPEKLSDLRLKLYRKAKQ